MTERLRALVEELRGHCTFKRSASRTVILRWADALEAATAQPKVEQISDGDWVDPTPQDGHVLVCCDCGLVHTVDFRAENGRVQFRPYRDEAATARWRADHPNLPMKPLAAVPPVKEQP